MYSGERLNRSTLSDERLAYSPTLLKKRYKYHKGILLEAELFKASSIRTCSRRPEPSGYELKILNRCKLERGANWLILN